MLIYHGIHPNRLRYKRTALLEGETTRRKARLLFLAVVFVDAGRDHIVISRCGKLPDETLQYLLMALAVWLISIAIKVGKRFALRPVPEIPSQRADNG